MADSITRTAHYGTLVPGWVRKTDSFEGVRLQSDHAIAAAAFLEARAVLDRAEQVEKDAWGNPDLSDRGKARRLREGLEPLRRQLGNSKTTLESIEKTLAEAREKAGKSDPAIADYAPLIAVIWQSLPPDPLQVRQIYMDATAEGDRLTCIAIESLPVTHQGRLGASLITELRQTRFMSSDPKLADDLAERNEWREDVSRIISHADQLLDELDAKAARVVEGSKSADPVRELAEGGQDAA